MAMPPSSVLVTGRQGSKCGLISRPYYVIIPDSRDPVAPNYSYDSDDTSPHYPIQATTDDSVESVDYRASIISQDVEQLKVS